MIYDENYYADQQLEDEAEALAIRAEALKQKFPTMKSRIERAARAGHQFLDAFERNLNRTGNAGRSTQKFGPVVQLENYDGMETILSAEQVF